MTPIQHQEHDDPRIAVVGLAGRFPGARDIAEFWRNLRAGVESITFLDEEDLLASGVHPTMLDDPGYVRAASILDGIDLFDAQFFGYNARDAALVDPQQRLFLECAWHALEDAGHVPGRLPGSIGVYAAANLSHYLLANILAGRAGFATAGEALELIVANDKDYLATRTSYHLGLDGPTVGVQTACSSSLVAVHLAAQALLNYECDMALAGGVALRLPQRAGYLHREGMIFSRDGHCRPFDAGATGTVAGNGLGVVVLRRLADAVADGDRIDAVILGSAVNNDGREKIGYTAPGVDGQARVIATALGVAQVEPATVGAIEAHGTGTPLGDPIEVTALTHVFGRDPGDRCALGSVKSNIGHLDSAAGVAGFIKAVLQLRHGELVPSLNFAEPNPEIDFERNPFYVNTELRTWKANGHPRRIGVSSFGMGGTNAHLVLEEAPPREPRPSRGVAAHILPVSGRSKAAVAAAVENLAAALADEQPPLADVAHTLQTGRAALPHRRVVVCRDVDDAVAALSGVDTGRIVGRVAADQPRVAWLFTGQGSQYPGMGRDLYAAEPVFREQVDRCARTAREDFGFDLLEVLFPAAPDRAAAARLTQTAMAQPALFTVEYALAALLRSWGLAPDMMVGHSVGEITAACLAGVFPLPDAFRLVAIRGRLMQTMPSGGMLSVALDEDELRPLLSRTLSLAAVNAPGLCVVSGPDAELAPFEAALAERNVKYRRLHTSHAFHSAMMEPILEPFATEIAGIAMREPTIPFVSNRTGRWVGAGEVTTPEYWVRHVREPVRFGAAVDLLTAGDRPLVLLEVGPGDVLGTLARQHPKARRATVLSTLPGPDGDRSALDATLTAVGALWTAGVEPDWAAVSDGGRRISLPGYPFQRRRYWIEPAVAGPDPDPAGSALVGADAVDDVTEPGALDSGEFDPRPDLVTEYVAARDGTERRLAELWQELLGVAPIGVHDNFVELGGHSLLAARMADRVAADFGVRVPLKEFFASPTLAHLAELTGAGSAAGDAPDQLPAAVTDPDSRYEPFPLTEMQQAQWIGRMSNFQGGNTAAHVYWEVENEGLDLTRLSAAWNRVLDRHEMLRAVVLPDGAQRILPETGRYDIPVLDLSTQPPEAVSQQLAELRERLSHEIRPPDRWPLFDIRATVLPDGRQRLHISFDLLIADIGSIRLLMRDWRRYYENPDATLPAIGLSYRDYVLAAEAVRATPLYQRALRYWRERVGALPPAPDLPLAVAPAAVTRPEFTARSVLVDPDRWRGFTERATAKGLTASAALMAAYAAAVGTWARSAQFTLNVTVINRLPLHPDVGDLVGEFASFDLLPVDLAAATGIQDLARRLQEQSWADLEHRYVNGVEILRELARRRGGTSGSVMPIVFTSTLVQQNDPEDGSMFGWLGEMTHQIAQTPQVWLDFAVLAADGGVELTWHWVRELFPEGLLESMFDTFHDLVGQLATSEQPWQEIPALLPARQQELIGRVNATEGPVPDGLLFEPLVAWARREPDRTAVIAPDGALRYGELYRHACLLAQRLRSLGVGPNQLVAVCADKSCAQIVAALGVQLAGGAYLPVDPDLPVERQDHLLEHGAARIVVTRAGGRSRTWPAGVREVPVDLAADPGEPEPPELLTRPTDLAYVIYTSGSTGLPKGVMIAHRGALNTVADVNERFGIGPDDRVLGLSSLSFDLSVWDVFGVLGAGGTLVLPPAEAHRDPAAWLDLVHHHRVTVWNSVPALAQMLADHALTRTDLPAPPLRLALLSGDWIPVGLPDALRTVAPGVEVISLGGATEASIWSIEYRVGEVDSAWESIPYGKPMRNQTFHVLDDRFQPCPVWVPGELYIGGVGVAEGYWRDPERTARSFVRHPVTGERLYRTGDLGRWLPDGNIEFLGREDFQVKIGGFRIELGEIEAALSACDGLRSVVAAAVGPDRHHRRLVAYLVPVDAAHRRADTDAALIAQARQLAESKLPGYMVPAVFVVLDGLPLSANGKVDRAALPDPGRSAPAPAGPGEAGTHSELAARILDIAAEVIGVARIDPRDSFFAIGGDSITGVRIIGRLNAEGIPLTLQDLFQTGTVGELIATLEARGVELTGTGDTGAFPLSPYQRHLVAGAAPDLPGSAGHVELRVRSCVTPERAAQALAALVARHDALRLRLVPEGGEPAGRIEKRDDEQPYVPLIDLSPLPEARRGAAMARMIEEMRGELDLVRGPVFGAALFDLGPDDRRLAWLVHEMAADGRSWAILLREFFTVLAQLDSGEPVVLPPPTEPFATWARNLPPVCDAGGDAPPSSGTGTGRHRITASLAAEPTRTLLETAAVNYRMSTVEVALASLAAVLGPRAGGRVRVDVERDLRSLPGPGVDVSRTVGQFSTFDTVELAAPDGDPDRLLVAAKEAYRAGADPGFPRVRSQILLRCLDRFGADSGADHPLAATSPVPWPVSEGQAAGRQPVTVTVLVFQDRLCVQWDLRDPDPAAVAEAERLSREQLDALRALAAYCGDSGSGDVRPSDFPLAGLDERELSTVLGELIDEGT